MQAGFWKRAGAYMVDYIILGVLTILFLLLIGATGMALDAAGIQKESSETVIGVIGVAVYLCLSLNPLAVHFVFPFFPLTGYTRENGSTYYRSQ